jgi:hypothetical protein
MGQFNGRHSNRPSFEDTNPEITAGKNSRPYIASFCNVSMIGISFCLKPLYLHLSSDSGFDLSTY